MSWFLLLLYEEPAAVAPLSPEHALGVEVSDPVQGHLERRLRAAGCPGAAGPSRGTG